MRLSGLGVWFSLWVREVPGSNPTAATRFFNTCIFTWPCNPITDLDSCYILYGTNNTGLNGLGVWFSLWVREVPGSNPGWAHFYIWRFIQYPCQTLFYIFTVNQSLVLYRNCFFYFRISLYFCSFRCRCRIFPCTDPTAHMIMKNPNTLARFLESIMVVSLYTDNSQYEKCPFAEARDKNRRQKTFLNRIIHW